MLVVSSQKSLIRMSPDGSTILGTITTSNLKRIAAITFDDANDRMFVGDSGTDKIVSMALNGRNYTEVKTIFSYVISRPSSLMMLHILGISMFNQYF